MSSCAAIQHKYASVRLNDVDVRTSKFYQTGILGSLGITAK